MPSGLSRRVLTVLSKGGGLADTDTPECSAGSPDSWRPSLLRPPHPQMPTQIPGPLAVWYVTRAQRRRVKENNESPRSGGAAALFWGVLVSPGGVCSLAFSPEETSEFLANGLRFGHKLPYSSNSQGGQQMRLPSRKNSTRDIGPG